MVKINYIRIKNKRSKWDLPHIVRVTTKEKMSQIELSSYGSEGPRIFGLVVRSGVDFTLYFFKWYLDIKIK